MQGIFILSLLLSLFTNTKLLTEKQESEKIGYRRFITLKIEVYNVHVQQL